MNWRLCRRRQQLLPHLSQLSFLPDFVLKRLGLGAAHLRRSVLQDRHQPKEIIYGIILIIHIRKFN